MSTNLNTYIRHKTQAFDHNDYRWSELQVPSSVKKGIAHFTT